MPSMKCHQGVVLHEREQALLASADPLIQGQDIFHQQFHREGGALIRHRCGRGLSRGAHGGGLFGPDMRERGQGVCLATSQLGGGRVVLADGQDPVGDSADAVVHQFRLDDGQQGVEPLVLGRPLEHQAADGAVERDATIQRDVLGLAVAAALQQEAGDAASRLAIIDLAVEIGLQEPLHGQRVEPMHHHGPSTGLLAGEEGHPTALVSGGRLHPGQQPGIRMPVA
jgi:hypothetical protein